MAKLVKVADPKRLSIQEVFALDNGKHVGVTPKFKGEIFMDFRDAITGELKKHKHIKNTRTWWFKNIPVIAQRIDSSMVVFIANDDGDWHVRKNVVRCTYANNGGNFFGATPSITVTPATYIYQYVAQFQAAPAGTTKTINCVGIVADNNTGIGSGNVYNLYNVIAATRLSGAGETQDEYTVIDVTYKLTCTL